jgi:hypothetical protein
MVVNRALRRMGYSEIEVKRIERIMFWTHFALVAAVLVGITFLYS